MKKMYTFKRTLVTFFVLFLLVNKAYANWSTDGSDWINMSHNNKISFILGLVNIEEALKNDIFFNNMKTTLHLKRKFYSPRQFFPKRTNIADIIKYFDNLYTMPRNRHIDAIKAYILCCLYFREDKDYSKLFKLYKKGLELPSGGTITKVIDGNTVIIRDLHKNLWTVDLKGLIAPNSSDIENSKTAKSFLEAVTLGETCRISYTTPQWVNKTIPKIRAKDILLFNKTGNLLGTLWLSCSELLFKTYKKYPKFKSLFFAEGNLINYPVNRVMLQCGLAKAKKEYFPVSGLFRTRTGLYLFGGEKHPIVEEIIKLFINSTKK